MNLHLRAARTVWNSLPQTARDIARRIIPLQAKRKLSSQVVSGLTPNSPTLDVADGRKFQVTEDRLFARLLLEGTYEDELSRVIASALRPGDVAVDVGANFGWYTTLFCAAVGSKGHVYSFEPEGGARGRLQFNVDLNNLADQVTISACAVGATAETARLQTSSDIETALSFVSLDAEDGPIVEMTTLSSELRASIGKVAVVKLDIEGYEYQALKGAEALLSSESPPIFQIEVNSEALIRANSSRSEVTKLLESYGYCLYGVTSRAVLFPDNGSASDIIAIPTRGVFQYRTHDQGEQLGAPKLGR